MPVTRSPIQSRWSAFRAAGHDSAPTMPTDPSGMSLLPEISGTRCQLAKFANLKWQWAPPTGNPAPAGTVVPGGQARPLPRGESMTVEPKVVAAIDLSTRGGFAWAAKSRLNDDPLTRQVTSAPGPAGALAGGPENLAAIASYLRETRMAALADIAEAGGTAEAEIRWCITIPAIWDERERNATRRAARDAGFPDDDERVLLLSAGPEAAALPCQPGLDNRIIVPANPALAVLEGAVHYAYDPRAFAGRRSKYTYGLALAMPWEPGVDSPMRKFRDKDQAMMCRDRFAVAVRRLERVAVDEPFPFVIEPSFAASAQVTVQLFRARAASPRYTDEEGCEPAGELAVDVSETVGQAERPLAVLLRFGSSQIQVEAIDLTTSKKFRAAVGFEQMP
jgi:hypothetical protein